MSQPFISSKRLPVVAVVVCSVLISRSCFAAEDTVLSFAEARRITIAHPMPDYPPGARSAGMKGAGIFVMCVTPRTGEVEKVEVYRSTGFRALDIEAIRALRRWRFRPGLPYSRIRIPINFAGW